MRQATVDRGEIIHLAGRHGLSPALRDGAPILSSGREAEGRCGWEAFFAAMERRGLALSWDEADPAAAVLAPRGEAPLRGHGSPGGVARSRRFLDAFLRRDRAGP